LPEIVRAFKSFSLRRINIQHDTPDVPVWQRNDYERIIRDDVALDHIRQYIRNNPAQWANDDYQSLSEKLDKWMAPKRDAERGVLQ